MNKEKINGLIDDATNEIEYVIREVKRRGFQDLLVEADCYESLRLKKEFKDLITGEIYEVYFLPDRHEFDWTIVSQIVETMTNPKVIEFAKYTLLPIAGGFASKAAYDILKATFLRIIQTMNQEALPAERRVPYEQMITDTEKLREYFEENKAARIAEIEAATQVPRERLYPLMKLLGFSHHRRKNNCLWHQPGSEKMLED